LMLILPALFCGGTKGFHPSLLQRQDGPLSVQVCSIASSLCLHAAPRLSQADKDRLLLGEVGLTAFIVAEMRHFVNESMVDFDQGRQYGIKWSMELDDKIQAGLADETGTIINEEYAQYYDTDDNNTSSSDMPLNTMDGITAVDLICNTTQIAFQEGFRQTGLLSALGSAILYFRDYFRTPTMLAACERVGLSDYAVAHHISDMYHHRTFRGAYTKTLAPSGRGEIAAVIAVGLATEGDATTTDQEYEEEEDHDDDECLLWSPTTPGVCIHWKSEDEAWRTKRFERIQMEGTKDPRRGGSGTTR